MDGEKTGSLRVRLIKGGGRLVDTELTMYPVLWSREGDQGKHWRKATVDIAVTDDMFIVSHYLNPNPYHNF